MESQSTRRHSVTRRRVLAAGAALPLFGIISRRGSAAEPQYKFKYANNMPVTHPINVRAHEILPKILQESNGELEVNVFPNNQLGGDSDMLSQLRSGALEMFPSRAPTSSRRWRSRQRYTGSVSRFRTTHMSGQRSTGSSALSYAASSTSLACTRSTNCGTLVFARSPAARNRSKLPKI